MNRMIGILAASTVILSDQHKYASHGMVSDDEWRATVMLGHRDHSESVALSLTLVFLDTGEDKLQARLRLEENHSDGRPLSSQNMPIGKADSMAQSIRSYLKRWKYLAESVENENTKAFLGFIGSLPDHLGDTYYLPLKARDCDTEPKTA